MSDVERTSGRDTAPGDERRDADGLAQGLQGYAVGLAAATVLTVASFFIASHDVVWGPALGIALAALAIAQMGVHLVFFLHITSGPDNLNNVLALAFGVLVVFLIIAGSVWIMAHLSTAMPSMNDIVRMQH